MTAIPIIGQIPERALPRLTDWSLIDDAVLEAGDWRRGLVMANNRSAGTVPRSYVATWDPASAETVAVIRAHRKAFASEAFEVELPCATVERVVYVGPLRIQWISSRFARVEVQLERAFPSVP